MRVVGRCVFVGMIAAAVLSQGIAQGPVAASVPEASQKAFAEGRQYEEREQLPAAVESYRAAVKAAGGGCVACLDAMARVQLNLGEYKESAATDAQVALWATDARAKAEAELREGMAYFELSLAEAEGQGAIEKNPKHAEASLRKAEEVLRQGSSDDPTDEAVRMGHARVLAAQKQDDDARREFVACAAMPGTSAAECSRALRFAKDVSLARGEPAPAFEARTMDGQKISLDSLAGKVVLVDFWATWCTFCKRDSDYVQSMLDSFDKDHFVLLEVDVDKSEDAWKDYVKEERLEGLQVYDEGHALQNLFHVTGYPTYVIIDGDGVVQLREAGAKGDLRGTVRHLLETTPSGSSTTAAARAGS